MTEIVNLRRMKKARARAAAAQAAAENRVRHGRGKAETLIARLEDRRASRALDGAQRESGDKKP